MYPDIVHGRVRDRDKVKSCVQVEEGTIRNWTSARKVKMSENGEMVKKPALLHFMSTEILWQRGAAHLFVKILQMTESMTGVNKGEPYKKD